MNSRCTLSLHPLVAPSRCTLSLRSLAAGAQRVKVVYFLRVTLSRSLKLESVTRGGDSTRISFPLEHLTRTPCSSIAVGEWTRREKRALNALKTRISDKPDLSESSIPQGAAPPTQHELWGVLAFSLGRAVVSAPPPSLKIAGRFVAQVFALNGLPSSKASISLR